jgi:hypothetical protein
MHAAWQLQAESFGWFEPSGPCTMNLQPPPGQNSKISKVLLKPLGPHHRAKVLAERKPRTPAGLDKGQLDGCEK